MPIFSGVAAILFFETVKNRILAHQKCICNSLNEIEQTYYVKWTDIVFVLR